MGWRSSYEPPVCVTVTTGGSSGVEASIGWPLSLAVGCVLAFDRVVHWCRSAVFFVPAFPPEWFAFLEFALRATQLVHRREYFRIFHDFGGCLGSKSF